MHCLIDITIFQYEYLSFRINSYTNTARPPIRKGEATPIRCLHSPSCQLHQSAARFSHIAHPKYHADELPSLLGCHAAFERWAAIFSLKARVNSCHSVTPAYSVIHGVCGGIRYDHNPGEVVVSISQFALTLSKSGKMISQPMTL